MIISPQSLDTNLSQIMDEVNLGKIQLPEFQRDWTWDDNRIRGILASLSQGYPMGAIMRLQYGNPDIRFKYRTINGRLKRSLISCILVAASCMASSSGSRTLSPLRHISFVISGTVSCRA